MASGSTPALTAGTGFTNSSSTVLDCCEVTGRRETVVVNGREGGARGGWGGLGRSVVGCGLARGGGGGVMPIILLSLKSGIGAGKP